MWGASGFCPSPTLFNLYMSSGDQTNDQRKLKLSPDDKQPVVVGRESYETDALMAKS